MGIEQLKKLKGLVQSRQLLAETLTEGLKSLDGLKTPTQFNNRTHVYYVYAMQLDLEVLQVIKTKNC